jgi:hypothetical protein
MRITAPEGLGMKVFTPRRRKTATVLLGVCLFIAPWIFEVPEVEMTSVNAWIVGACIIVAALRVPIVSARGEPDH